MKEQYRCDLVGQWDNCRVTGQVGLVVRWVELILAHTECGEPDAVPQLINVC